MEIPFLQVPQIDHPVALWIWNLWEAWKQKCLRLTFFLRNKHSYKDYNFGI